MLAYVAIARPDHWIKNIFVLPGILLAFFFYPQQWSPSLIPGILIGLVAVCLTASSNYVLNELLDAERDKEHPVKKYRPIPSGRINIRIAYAEWILLAVAGAGLGFFVNPFLGGSCIVLWFAGTLYNIPPIRLKDIPYADVLSESINNPIRLCMGWYCAGLGSAPPMSIALAYWMFGAFLMATKRFAEYREINDPACAARYRKSFSFYNDQRLLVSILYYASLFAMFAAVFITRYHVEIVLATPLVAYAMAYYLHLGFKPNSPAQYPERLYKEHKLTATCLVAFAACAALMFADLPWFERLLFPWHLAPHATSETAGPVSGIPAAR